MLRPTAPAPATATARVHHTRHASLMRAPRHPRRARPSCRDLGRQLHQQPDTHAEPVQLQASQLHGGIVPGRVRGRPPHCAKHARRQPPRAACCILPSCWAVAGGGRQTWARARLFLCLCFAFAFAVPGAVLCVLWLRCAAPFLTVGASCDYLCLAAHPLCLGIGRGWVRRLRDHGRQTVSGGARAHT